MSNLTRFVLVSVSIILFVSTASIALYYQSKGGDLFNESYGKLVSNESRVQESDLKQYVNTKISGGVVTELIVKYRSKFPILVRNESTPMGFYNTSQIQDSKSDTYVNPHRSFNFYLGENQSHEPEILIFVQSSLIEAKDGKTRMGLQPTERVQNTYDLEEAMNVMYATELEKDIAKTEILVTAYREELERLIETAAERDTVGCENKGSMTDNARLLEQWREKKKQILESIESSVYE